ncbi:hypothetical protein CF319_g7707 [Tilletia indica]|uniref:Uncharacterized protein n=1 Tax=Tilletia indica TaxID=43049 RepID=A0A8T8T4Q7_9BASI|nr:hypothetical protein CF319_g7707 [Tilletia indica]KAE8254364.1 hypothetical protein A4X13_0g3448 [Tilletia indica]
MSSQSIYDRFDLLPPPPPTVFSHHGPTNRMRLPNFQTVQDAQDFLDALAMTAYSQSARFRAARVALACIVAMIFITIVTKETRYYARRQRWILRLVHTPEGTVIVPNMTSVFASFGVVFMGLNCTGTCVQLGYMHRNLPTPHLPIWIFFQLIPLWWATFWSSWASSHGRVPGSQRYELIQRRSRRPWMKPLASNLVWIAIPILHAILAVIFMVLADVEYEHARKRALITMVELSNAPELSEQLLINIQEIWVLARNCAYWMAVSCLLWFIATFGLTVLYASLSFRLVAKLHEHLSVLLQLKQSREVVGAVRIDLMTTVTVSPSEPMPKRWFGRVPTFPSTSATVEDDKQELLLASPTSGLYPTIDGASAKHEPLGDGKGFRRVIWLYGLQSLIVVAGTSLFSVISLFITIIVVDAVEVNQLEGIQRTAQLLIQILAAGLGISVIVSNVLLERSHAFLTLMHGTYKAGQIQSATSDRNPLKKSDNNCPDAQQLELATAESVWTITQSLGDEPYDHTSKLFET